MDHDFRYGDRVVVRDDEDNRRNHAMYIGRPAVIVHLNAGRNGDLVEIKFEDRRDQTVSVFSTRLDRAERPFRVGDRIIMRDDADNSPSLRGYIGRPCVVTAVGPEIIDVKFEDTDNVEQGFYPRRFDLIAGSSGSSRKFKTGDLVEVTQNQGSAAVGARAVVKGYETHFGTEYLSVVWVRDALAGTQKDGCYYDKDFQLYNPAKMAAEVVTEKVEVLVPQYPEGRLLTAKVHDDGLLYVVKKMNGSDVEVDCVSPGGPSKGGRSSYNVSYTSFEDTGLQMPFPIGEPIEVVRTAKFDWDAAPGALAYPEAYRLISGELDVVVRWSDGVGSLSNGQSPGAYPVDRFTRSAYDRNAFGYVVGDLVYADDDPSKVAVVTGIDTRSDKFFLVWLSEASLPEENGWFHVDNFTAVVDAASSDIYNGREDVKICVNCCGGADATASNAVSYIVRDLDGNFFGPYDNLADAGAKLEDVAGGSLHIINR
jgi:hypothetical protein